MPDQKYVLDKIVLDRNLTKVEKLKKMYITMRELLPHKRKEDVYEYCKHYYEKKKIGKMKNESYYYG